MPYRRRARAASSRRRVSTSPGCVGGSVLDCTRPEIAVKDALLVRVLHATQYVEEQSQPCRHVERAAVAVVGQPGAAHRLHHDVRPTLVGGPRVEHPRDRRVIHQRQGGALAGEAPQDGVGIHAPLDDLEGDLAAQRRLLHGQVDLTHPALAKQGGQSVGPDVIGDHHGVDVLRVRPGARRRCGNIEVGRRTRRHRREVSPTGGRWPGGGGGGATLV